MPGLPCGLLRSFRCEIYPTITPQLAAGGVWSAPECTFRNSRIPDNYIYIFPRSRSVSSPNRGHSSLSDSSSGELRENLRLDQQRDTTRSDARNKAPDRRCSSQDSFRGCSVLTSGAQGHYSTDAAEPGLSRHVSE